MSRKKIDMLDAKDAASFRLREQKWMARKGPRVGDFVMMPGEDGVRRFAHDWGTGKNSGIQPTNPRIGDGNGSYFMFSNGFGDHSGSLDSPIPHDKLVDTMTVIPGIFWWFHHEEARAHNGIWAEFSCRLYRYEP
jgi:hypothetical protein